MNVFSFQEFKRLAFLVIFTSVCTAMPVQTPIEVEPEAMFSGVSMERVEDLSYDPWSHYRERVDIETVESTSTILPDDTTSSTEQPDAASDKNVDPLSLVYYIGSFAALLLFFLVVSCSECCCEKSPSNAARTAAESLDDCHLPDDTNPPPPYDEFAPPTYSSLFENEDSTKTKADVFVVAVHDTHRVPP